jgi:2-polyprenyl-3-methyl-5-hydroxy-6-metoxy-1,4-benzoquinol methylase
VTEARIDGNSAIRRAFRSLSDEAWLAVLIRSIDESTINGIQLPTLPDAGLQESFVGSSGETALREAFVFYREIKRYAAQLGIPIDESLSLVDFGCGWGRNYRLLLREVSTRSFLGVDVDPECVRICRSSVPMGTFEQCDIMPPLALTSGSIDIVYAYSVFSHLSEHAHLGWIHEFHRLLRPGGMLIVTTLKPAHLDIWEQLRVTGGDHWREALASVRFDSKNAGTKFEQGYFLYCPIGGGGIRESSFYGEAIVSPYYVDERWDGFARIAYVDAAARGPQALIVAKRLAG